MKVIKTSQNGGFENRYQQWLDLLNKVTESYTTTGYDISAQDLAKTVLISLGMTPPISLQDLIQWKESLQFAEKFLAN